MDIEGAIETIIEIDALLERYGTVWRKHTKRFLSDINDCPAEDNERMAEILVGIRKFCFKHGMGSLYDLYLSRDNGDNIDDERCANQQLTRLVWKLSRQMGAQ